MLSILATVAAVTAGRPQAQPLPDSGLVTARANAYVEPLVRSGELSGIVLLARRGQVVYQRAFGFADAAGRVPMTVATPNAVASISKPLTEIIASRLAAEGRLTLSDPLSRWLPEFPQGDRITVEMLLGHRAGIRHRVTRPEEDTVARTAATMIPLIADTTLLFEPGSQRSYSSMGYVVLARVLELAGGAPYWQLLEEQILRPAGAAASADATRPGLPRVARPIRRGPDGPVPAPMRNLSFLVGAGSLYSTPGDLFRIYRTLDAGGYGAPARDRWLGGRGTAFWTGFTDGYRAYLQADTAGGVFIAFTSNRMTGAGDLLLRDLPRIVRGETVPPPNPPEPRPVTLAEDLARRVAGDYEFQPGLTTPLTFVSPRLAAAGDFLLIPTSDTTFFSIGDYAEVTIVRGPDGAVNGLQWGATGPRFPRRR